MENTDKEIEQEIYKHLIPQIRKALKNLTDDEIMKGIKISSGFNLSLFEVRVKTEYNRQRIIDSLLSDQKMNQ